MDAELLAEIRRLTSPEDGALAEARARAAQVTTLPPPEVGALLRWLATGMRHAVEIGAAGGVTGLWLLKGMDERGLLTSVEHDPHQHGLATEAFERAGVAGRVRSILGEPLTVLDRLSDDGYDLCVVQGRPREYPDYLEHALRLVRAGGMVVAPGVLRPGEAGDALARSVQLLIEDERFDAVVLPFDDGVAIARVTS